MRIRIATAITRLNIGGASPIVIGLDAGFRDYGHDAILIVGVPQVGEGHLEDDAEKVGAQLVHVPHLCRNPSPLKDVRALVQLFRLFRQYRPDVVATHMSKAGALGRVAARLAGVPVVVHTYHGQGFQVFEQRWKEVVTLSIERVLARIASGIIVVSEMQRDEFLRLRIAPTNRIRVIRYGLDLDPFVKASKGPLELRRELGFSEGTPLVGVVGRVVAMKGQDIFIRAVQHLASRFPEARFLIVGDGEGRPAFETLARELGVDDRIHFLGWRRDVPAVLHNLDVVVLPTVLGFEGVPVALIEALAAARAAVASDVGGVVDVIRDGKTGLVVPPRNPEALAAAISSLLSDPQRAAELGRNGQERVLQLYQRDRMVAETEAYFQELLSKKRRPFVRTAGVSRGS